MMNIFVALWLILKNKFTTIYNKECIEKDKLLKFLDKSLPNKKKFSAKDVIEKIKDFSKKN